MAFHHLTQLGDNLAIVVGQLRNVADRSAFVQTSRRIHTFASECLYSTIDISSDSRPVHGRSVGQRLLLLSRTLQANSKLAELVRHLKVDLVPVATVTRLIDLCTSLRMLHWLVRNREAGRIPDYLLMPAPLPPVTSHIRHLTVHYFIQTPFWPNTLSNCLISATGIRSLRLFTTLQTMSGIFGSIGPQIEDLKVEYVAPGGNLPYSATKTIFIPLTHLKRLRLPDYRPWQCDNAKLPDSLQRLILNTATHDDLRAMCERLSNLAWCPKMQRLPLINHPLIPVAPFGEVTRTQLRDFRSACERAKTACKGRPTWLDSPEDFDRWAARLLPVCQNAQL